MLGNSAVGKLFLFEDFIEFAAINLLLNSLVPLTLLDGLHVAIQALVPALVFAYFNDCVFSISCIQLIDQLRDEVLVFERFLYGGQMWAGSLALSRVCLRVGVKAVAIGASAAVDLISSFFF